MSRLLPVIFIGLVIRLFLVGNTGFVADISFWKSWSLAAIDHGIVWTSFNTNINYPPGFIYILYLMGKLYSLIGNPHDYNTFWRENNFGFLFVSKSIAIFADIIIACLIYWFFKQQEKLRQLGAGKFEARNTKSETNSNIQNPDDKNEKINSLKNSNLVIVSNLGFRISDFPLILSSLFFLNPVVILDSALWGQVESFGILFTLVAILLLFYRRPLAASFIFTVGTQMKLQNIIFIPLYFLFIFRYFDLKTTIRCLAVAIFAFFLVNLPFLLAGQMKQVLYLLTVNSDYFPWLSLNAHNLWWIVAGAQGMQITDKITILGILNAKTIGLILFSIFYLLFSILVFLKPTPRNFLLALALAIFAFFLFTTQSHERYSYPVIVLLLFLYPFLKSVKREALSVKKNNNFPLSAFRFPLAHYFWLLYSLLTLAIFFNIHHGLILNYPQNGFSLLTRLSTLPLSILNSYFLILLFFLLLPYVFSQISFLILVLCSFFGLIIFIFLNLSYLQGKVSLTSFKPIVAQQDYGSLQINKSVSSSSEWKSWNRLSVDYLYYRKGFGTHANSYLVFDIDRKFKIFSTDFGVDTSAGTPASVVFKIYGDDKELFASAKMGRFDFPKHAQVDVSGVKKLGLVVTDA
ncbi:hypothetical protein FJY90_07175, partial [Candidatus Gottesmanbacteria bacterium]|nr:hypothetical protein [Candidatus Gottesmanbacteria bacterium]